jgi:hypothetical protein
MMQAHIKGEMPELMYHHLILTSKYPTQSQPNEYPENTWDKIIVIILTPEGVPMIDLLHKILR